MNCDACVGVEAEHHQCDECVQEDIARERALRAERDALLAVFDEMRAELDSASKIVAPNRYLADLLARAAAVRGGR